MVAIRKEIETKSVKRRLLEIIEDAKNTVSETVNKVAIKTQEVKETVVKKVNEVKEEVKSVAELITDDKKPPVEKK
jgi:hypothetical protein